MRDSRLVDPYDLEDVLGDGGDQTFPRLQPKKKKKFRTRMLGKLAYFSITDLESFALSDLEVDFEEIDEKRFNSSRSSWLFNLAVFDAYAKKSNSSPQVNKPLIQINILI